MARLTLFNARRVGEPGSMLLTDWTDAEKGAWIDPQLVDSFDTMDKYLLDHFKLAYQTGKGNRLVPIKVCDKKKILPANVAGKFSKLPAKSKIYLPNWSKTKKKLKIKKSKILNKRLLLINLIDTKDTKKVEKHVS